MSLFGLLRAGSGSSTIRGPFVILTSSPQSHLHSSPPSPSILSSLTFRSISCNQRHRGFFSKDHHHKNTPSTTYSPYLDDATTPIPPTDPMTDHTARSTHPLPSDPYCDDDTQPIVQATIPPPTPAEGTGAAMTDPFNPSSIQLAAATATRSRFKSLRTRGRGVGTLPSEKSAMIMEGVQRVQNMASWIGKGTTTETKLRG
jgi:hypothetical protein